MADVSIKDVMVAYAGEAVVDAQSRGLALDFTEGSLNVLDRLLGHFTKDGLLAPKTNEEESAIWVLSKRYGAYLGQVVIAEVGGAWELHDLPDGSAQVILRSHGVQMFPLEKIYKRLVKDEYSGVSGYCGALRTILQRRSEKT
jgi:hypothetical protein